MASRKPNQQKAAARSGNPSVVAGKTPVTKKPAQPVKSAEPTKPVKVTTSTTTVKEPSDRHARPALESGVGVRQRTARLRLVHVDPWSVMRMTFLLSIVLGIATVIAVTMIWLILSGAGVWTSINHSVRDTVGSTTTVPFDITHYLGLGRVVGFTMLAAVIDAVFFTVVATLGAFLYNLSANLLGGIEATYAEER